MIVVMKRGATSDMVSNVRRKAAESDNTNKLETGVFKGDKQYTVHLKGTEFDKNLLDDRLSNLEGVDRIIHISTQYKIASRDFGENKVEVSRGDTSVLFNGNTVTAAGPCTIESEEQMKRAAESLSELGVKILRGGAFKPRSSPYDFQGLGEKGLKIARKVADQFGMLFVTEAMSPEHVPEIAEYADIIQIGTRNMQNYFLLKAAGKTNKPVMLKRGFSATLDEFLLSAEYILCEQDKPRVILCLRGIRSFESDTRNTLDIGAILSLREKTWLPIFFDPSHASGNKGQVKCLSQMALIAGYNGIIIESHPCPGDALCDGKQSLTLKEFGQIYQEIVDLAQKTGRNFV